MDICWMCDGTGERDCLSGAPCYTCHGTGLVEDDDVFEWDDDAGPHLIDDDEPQSYRDPETVVYTGSNDVPF